MKVTPHELPNRDTAQSEKEANGALLTPSQTEGILFAGVDTVDSQLKVEITDAEAKDGVTSIDAFGISTYGISRRPEAYSKLSTDFKGAIVRLLRRGPSGNRDTSEIIVDTYHGEPQSEGAHTSERRQEVYKFGPDGRVVSGQHQIIKEHWGEPSNAGVIETVLGDPIVGDELVERARSRVKDIETCVSAGI